MFGKASLKNTSYESFQDLYNGIVFEKTTEDIKVSVEPSFLEDQSDPSENHYVWAYHIKIENLGERTLKLQSRYWKITDAYGMTHEIQGDGVVGEQPIIEAGQSYEYTSGAPLHTPGGIMSGLYYMRDDNGNRVVVEVPAFSLDSPYQSQVVH